MKISVLHPPILNNPTTTLGLDYNSGVASFTVKNTSGFVLNKFICLGPVGFEQAELLQIQTITAPQTIATATNSNFPHNADDQVSLFDFNQVRIYRSTTGINGTYSLQTTTNIDVSEDFTVYEDTTALTTYYYKFSYYNSLTTLETDLSDPIAATGFVFYSLKTMVDRVLSIFGDSRAEFVSRDEVADYLNEFYEDCQRKLAVITKRSQLKWDSITTQSGVDEYPLFADFLVEKGIKISQDNGISYPYSASSINVDNLGSVQNTRILYGYSIYGSTLKLDPIPQSNSELFKIFYVPTPTTLTLQTDTLSAPFTNSSGMFVKYALGMCKLKDKKLDQWTSLTQYAEHKLDEFLSYIKLTQTRHPRYSQIVTDEVL